MALHPTTRILIGLSLIVASSALGLVALCIATFLFVVIAIAQRDVVAWRWVKRARLLLIIPPLINGYVMAGDGVFANLDVWSPTWQGLTNGVTQSLRLLVALLGLRLVLRPLSREQMAVGLATLLTPISYFGADLTRLARRLSLTVAYLEKLDGKTAGVLLRGTLPSQSVPQFVPDPQVGAAQPMGRWDVALISLTLIILCRVVA